MDRKLLQRLSATFKGRALNIVIFREGSVGSLRLVINRTELIALLLLSFALLGGLGTIAGNYLGSAMSGAHQAELQAHVDRVRSYETQLMQRAVALEAMISEAGEGSPDTPEKFPHFAVGGVGGREFSLAPVIIRSGKDQSAHLALNHQGESAKNVVSYLESQIENLRSIPLGLPVQGALSSGFGKRVSPFSRRVQMHDGIDISVDHASVVTAVAEGSVVTAGYQGAYGRAVLIDHGNGYETLYGHLSSISVKVGQKICRGQKIGLVGSSGRSTGPHLHYEVRVAGEPKDPSIYLRLVSLLKYLS